VDAEVVVADEAVTAAKAATKADATAQVTVAADAEVEVAEDAEPEVVQAARLNQGQAPTVAANAQAQAQAKAAEHAAEEGSDAAGPAKLEPLPTQAAPVATAARGEGAAAALRMREGLQAQVQERIDHIADQLATRLRLSQAAGGSHVQLSLKPRELGEVTVQMNVRDGAVAATILVDKADTLRTLQTNIEDLKRSLENQGLAIQEFSVDVRGDSGAGGANARAAADLRGSANRSSNGATASVAGAAGAVPGLSGDREVDPEDVHDGDVSVLA
jgi:flagellar hook-length control protein FliK